MKSDTSSSADLPSDQVLRNFDLLELIFEHFGGPSEGVLLPNYSRIVEQSTKQNLLWASLTSKSFVEPALNVLWRHMPSIWPLFHLLPNLCQDEDGNYGLIGIVDDHGLLPLLSYGRRIKVLHIAGSSYSSIPSNLLDILSKQIQESGLFSSLRRLLIWMDKLQRAKPFLLSIIRAPNMDSLHIKRFIGKETETTALLHFVASEMSIRTLEMTGNFSAINPILPHFTNLQHLYLCVMTSVIPARFLRGCASSMISLQSLKMHLFAYEGSETNIAQPEAGYIVIFASLLSLELGGFPNAMGCIMDTIHTPRLRTLVLCLLRGQAQHMNTFLSSFNRINRYHATHGLQRLSVTFDQTRPVKFAFNQMVFQMFERLEVLEFNAPTMVISMSDLSRFLSTDELWFSLKELSLRYGNSDIDMDETLSIAALSLISNSCPNLLKLEISIFNDDQSGLLYLEEPDPTQMPHNLVHLILSDLPINWYYTVSLADAFSSFLNGLFPGLKVAQYYGCHESEYQWEWWKRVEAGLRLDRGQG